MSTVSDIQSTKIRQIARGESIKYTANFGPSLRSADTLSSVTSTAQTDGDASLTVGSGAINTGGAVTVDGRSLAVSTVVQYRVTVPSNAAIGLCEVTVVVATTGGDTLKMACRLMVVA